MGEYADDILDGTVCQSCGEVNLEMERDEEGYVTPPGIPYTCPACEQASTD